MRKVKKVEKYFFALGFHHALIKKYSPPSEYLQSVYQDYSFDILSFYNEGYEDGLLEIKLIENGESDE
jgi:hypothetical protein